MSSHNELGRSVPILMYIYSHKWLKMMFRIYNGATEKSVKTSERQWWGWDQRSGLLGSPA